jgi:hypothetical protein
MYRPIPKTRLAVFLGANHFLTFQKSNNLLPTVAAFLNGPG